VPQEYNDGRHTIAVAIAISTSDMGVITRANFGTDLEARLDFNPVTRETLPLGWCWKRDKQTGNLVQDKEGNYLIEQEREQGTDPVTNAFAQAFKRAAAVFKVGLHENFGVDTLPFRGGRKRRLRATQQTHSLTPAEIKMLDNIRTTVL
jgi:hypothetical protein